MNVNLKVPGKKLEHHGIKIEFVGQIGEKLFCYPTLNLPYMYMFFHYEVL